MRAASHPHAALAAFMACAFGGAAGSHVAEQSIAPNLQYDFTTHATSLNEALLHGYDKFVPPRSQRRNASESGSLAGTDVEVQLRFYKVASVHTAEGSLSMQTWMRLRWQDDRLAWDPALYGGITRTRFLAVGINKPEETNIWVPDLTIYNLASPLNDVMSGQLAEVDSNGTVFWSRPGVLDILCRFSGLVAFPFDTLQCTMEMGGWMMSDALQGLSYFPVEEGGSFVLAWDSRKSKEETTGPAYHEYRISEITSSVQAYAWDTGPDHYTILRYTINLGRVQIYYMMLVIIPCILLTCFSFAVFWLKPAVGERLGYGITLILATEVFKLVIDEVVPVRIRAS